MTDHHPDCPLHEDYELTDSDVKRIDPAEVLELVRAADSAYASVYAHTAYHAIRKALRPFLWMLDCRCEEIEEAYREKAAEDRAER